MTILEVSRTQAGVEVNLLNGITSAELEKIQGVLKAEKNFRMLDFMAEGERLRKKYFG